MIVKLRQKNARHRDLTPGQRYVVIGMEADELRILNDAARPYLYPPNLFQVLDPHEPGDWFTEFGEDGERYAYPSSSTSLVSLKKVPDTTDHEKHSFVSDPFAGVMCNILWIRAENP